MSVLQPVSDIRDLLGLLLRLSSDISRAGYLRAHLALVPVWGILIWGVLWVRSSDSVAGEVRAGVAQETFALPKGVPLAGYSRRRGKPSRGVHDSVGVRALVLTDEQTTVALVSCDLLIVDERLAEAVHQRLVAVGLPSNLIVLLAATHTHSGPGAYGARFLEKMSMGHFDPQVFDAIVHAVVQAISQAHAALSPAQLAYGASKTQGVVVNRVDPGGLVDDELIVCALYRDRTHTPFAMLLNFAAHPTTLGVWNMQVSADYPGVVVRTVEQRIPGSTCFFFAGAVGDQAPVKSGDGFERAEWIGQTLAAQAVDLVKTMHPTSPVGLGGRQARFMLPPAEVRLGHVVLPRWIGQRLVDDDATVSLMTIGDVALLGVPCDLTASLGAQLRKGAQSRGLQPMIIGFASDYIGYCVPAALYEEKKYESSMAFNGPKTGALVVERLIQLLDEVATRNHEPATRQGDELETR